MNAYETKLLDKIYALEMKLVFLERQFQEQGDKILKDGGWERASILWDAAADVRKMKEMNNDTFLKWAENYLNS